ncbi:MAG: hypothetical protein ACRDLA_18580, partial [Thermoleophilaceae bacterium]
MIARPPRSIPLLALALLLGCAAPAAAQDPADQPPFGGEPVPQLVLPASPTVPPPGFRLSGAEATAIADATDEVQEERAESELTPRAGTRGGRWEVTYREAAGERRALVHIDDASGEVLEAWAGTQVETKLARGYEDAVSGDLNEAWFWIPLCVLFVAPFVDPRRPFRLLHLDLLALLGFSASLFFFNKGEIGVSAPLVYPVLGYLFARALLAGLRPADRRDRLLPLARPSWLLAGIVALVALHAGFSISQEKVIDVGLAGVVGADRLLGGEDVYSENFDEGLPSRGDVRGDVYGPVNYLAYVPFEQAFPYDAVWDDVPAAR